MDRDEFMELVYETFADEPDNVLANGIIEAADAYAEHEKAQLSCEGTIISRQWLLECVDEGWIKFDTEEDANRFIHLVRDIAPGVQSVATDTNVGDTISRQAVIDVLSLGKEMLSRVLDDIDVVGTVREKYSWGLGLIESYINDINELPSAQPEPQWIPCSERMPEEHEWIGTKKFGTTISDEVYVTFENEKGERFCQHMKFQNGELSRYDQFHMDTWFKGGKPIAWMPLPDPYKPNNK